VVQATGCPERLVFTQVFDTDLRVCAGTVLDEVAEDGLVVVANDEDFVDFGDAGDGLKAVLDDGVAGDFEQWLFCGSA
jgi:hypothetical protein